MKPETTSSRLTFDLGKRENFIYFLGISIFATIPFLQDLHRRFSLWRKTGIPFFQVICDGGIEEEGTMAVVCSVVDFDVAEAYIKAGLDHSEFKDYTRIYKKS